MGIDDAVKLGFSNYMNFSDRACQSEFWYFFLFYTIGALASGTIDRWIVGLPIIGTIFILATILPTVSVAVRRLHDLDRSGWWVLLDLVPLVGWIILIIWLCTKGTDGPNRFGAIAILTDGHNRLPLNLTYRIRYSSRNFSCIRHPQNNKPRRAPRYAARIGRPHLGRCPGIAGGHIVPKPGPTYSAILKMCYHFRQRRTSSPTLWRRQT
jgi:uncharacterized membrane protein YhaH (DUF805 family)